MRTRWRRSPLSVGLLSFVALSIATVVLGLVRDVPIQNWGGGAGIIFWTLLWVLNDRQHQHAAE